MNRSMAKSHISKRIKKRNRINNLWNGGADEADQPVPPVQPVQPVKQVQPVPDNVEPKSGLVEMLAKDDTVNETTISKNLNMLFKLLAIVGFLCMISFIVVSIVNMFIIMIVKGKQKKDAKYNKKLIRDMMEYNFFDYAKYVVPDKSSKCGSKTKNEDTEKSVDAKMTKDEKFLKLYTSIYILNILVSIVVVYIIIYGLATAIIHIYYFAIKDNEAKNALSIRFDKVVGFAMACYFIVAIISIYIIKYMFKEKAINKVLKDLNDKAYDLKLKIYSNLYVETSYLDTIASENFALITNKINKELTTNQVGAMKMIFTYNIYKHYMNNFNGYDSFKDDFKKRFTVGSLKQQPGTEPFEPVEFLFYNDDIEIREFEDHFLTDLEDMIKVSKDAVYTNAKTGYMAINDGSSIQEEVNIRLKAVSDAARYFKKSTLDQAYKAIFNMIRAMFIFAVTLLVVILLLVYTTPQGKAILDMVKGFIQEVYTRIKDLVTNIINKMRGN